MTPGDSPVFKLTLAAVAALGLAHPAFAAPALGQPAPAFTAQADVKAGRAVATPTSKPYGCSIKYAD